MAKMVDHLAVIRHPILHPVLHPILHPLAQAGLQFRMAANNVPSMKTGMIENSKPYPNWLEAKYNSFVRISVSANTNKVSQLTSLHHLDNLNAFSRLKRQSHP